MENIKDLLKQSSEILFFSLFGVLLLFAFMLIGFLVSFYIAQSLEINEYSLGLLSISFTLLLVVITAIYVYLTYSILKETTKVQKISFVEKRLEDFYYPLLQILKLKPNSIDDDAVLLGRMEPYWNYMDKINKIESLIYLARESSKNKIEEFIDEATEKGSFDTNSKNVEELKNILYDDIDYLTKQLDSIANR